MARGAINLPIITEYNPKGLERAIADFKKLETNGEKAAFAFRKAFKPAIGALGGLVAAAGPAIAKASDLEEATAKVGEIFGDAANQITDFSKTADVQLGQSQIAVLEAAGTFGTFGKAAGLGGEELAKFSNDFTALAADLASFNNTSPEEAVQAIGAALRGESEPLRRYGVLLDDATLRAEALTLGIYDGSGALTAQQKILAAQAVIYKQTGDAQGDFARTSEGLANQTRILKARFENVATEIGAALLPIMDKLLPVVEGLLDVIANNTDVVVVLAGAIAATATAVIAVNAAMKVYDAYTTLIKAKNKLLDASFKNINGRLVAGAALIGAAVVAYQFYRSEKDRVKKITDDFTEALKLEGDAQYEATEAILASQFATDVINDSMKELGLTAGDLAKAVKGETSPAFDDLEQRFRDVNDQTAAADVNARNLRQEFGNQYTQVRNLVFQVDKLRDSYNTATDQVARLDEVTGELDAVQGENLRTQEAMADAVGKVERALILYEEQLGVTADEIRDLTQATLEQFNNDLAYENQVRRTKEALAEYNEITNNAAASTDEIAQAQADAAAQALAQASAAVRANEDLALFTDETERAIAQNELLVIELGKVAQALDPSDPLRQQLLGYIAELNSIPAYKETNVVTRFTAIQEAQQRAVAAAPIIDQAIAAGAAGRTFIPFADGGIVTQPTLGLVGEAGPEAIIPLDRMRELGGNTINITVTSADPQAVVQAIRKYNRTQGPAPIKVA